MNNYYLVSLQTTTDGTNIQSITPKETWETAISDYHSTLASNYVSETLKSFAVDILNSNGNIMQREYDGASTNVFYVVNIQETAEGTPVSISAYDNKDNAYSAYHSELASNYASQVLTEFTVFVLNAHGAQETNMYEHYVVSPEPEPEPNEEA